MLRLRGTLAFVAAVALSCGASAAAPNPQLLHRLQQARGPFNVVRAPGHSLLLYGTIGLGDDAVFAQALSPGTTTLVVNSAGGEVRPALAMAHLIRARGLNVIVDGFCASSCADYLFVAGKSQQVHSNSIVLWHGGVTPEMPQQAASAVREQVLKLGQSEDAAAAAAGQTVAEWTQVLREQRRFYRELGLPDIILEGLNSFNDARPLGGTAPGNDMLFISYRALRCAGLKGLRRAWAPSSPAGWKRFFEQAGILDRRIAESSALERTICPSS